MYDLRIKKVQIKCASCRKQMNNLIAIEDTASDEVSRLRFICESCGEEHVYHYPRDKSEFLRELYVDTLKH